ncbi:type II restriction endonuclease subunit M, partial [Limosilactobacillus fermentum]|uniref:BREX-1 system adenine-specific DNA-methyltransferase PglX n=1 Tax=Limosilactobacillus fermentum TaxID=1613 RepID=UPI0021A903A3
QTAQQLLEIIATAETMTQRYDVVVTNPPYLNKMNSTLKKYVKKHYKDYSADLFSVFIWHNINMTKVNGYAGYMTPFVWMFIKSYEKLRTALLSNVKIDSLIQLEYSAFEEATVPINTFVLKNTKNDETGTYLRLSAFKGGMMIQAEKVQEAIADPGVKYLYRTNQTNFGKIPGSPIAYWASQQLIRDFETGRPLSKFVDPRQGLATADNNRFLRQWFEVAYSSIKFDARSIEESISSRKKWFPYNKGGAYRKWYGNYDYIVNWENDGYEIKNFKDSNGKVRSRPQNTDYYFREAITWSKVTSGLFNVRYRTIGSIFDTGGNEAFSRQGADLHFFMGLLNSKIGGYALSFINPTINMLTEDIKKVPIIITNEPVRESAAILAKMNTKIGKDEWDSFEVSWDFKLHPLIHNIVEHTVLVIFHIHRRISKIRVTAKHPFKKLATWWHKIQNVPKKCQTFGLGGH